MRQVTHALLTRPPLDRISASTNLLSFDLHVLSTPPAFILSQDQTLMFKFDFWFKISSSFFFYPFYLAILSYQFLKLLFIEFSGVGIYCSVIKVLFLVVFQFSATTSLFYHIADRLSTTFYLFFSFYFLSFSRQVFTISCLSVFVNNFFILFSSTDLRFMETERRKRDLNPRAGCPTYTLSRGASSAS